MPTLHRHAASAAARPDRRITALLRRDVLPESFEALVAAKQRREDRRVRQQDVAGPLVLRRHPQEHVELAVAGLRERMRPRRIDRLLREQVNGRRIGRRDGVMREMRMEVERLYALEPAAGVEVAALDERLKLLRSLDGGWTQSVLIVNGDTEPLHHRARVLAEPLLARHERIAVVRV